MYISAGILAIFSIVSIYFAKNLPYEVAGRISNKRIITAIIVITISIIILAIQGLFF